ncbi:MCP four helix bundle domain-containing protein [Flavobacterium sp. LS1P3]|jgi:MFS superfamily sulfate permease-like transporter|uniref:MCP four helix bundle domain-containing protein n=1 Tax=Flavobacterium sp. LS1P3 TaxID=3401720 RepID=UPI003AAE4220
MKDLKKYSTKTKASFVLLIVMFIILLSNLNTQQNSKRTNEHINTIYNDRLVVARYIFQYANELYFIKANAVATKLNEVQKKEHIAEALKKIKNIDKLYLKTVLTPKEKISFTTFLASCSAINKETKNKNWNQVNNTSNQALQTLELLSQIQSKEGKSKLTNSNTLHNDNNLMGQLQIALLVILGGITLYLLMSKKTKISIKIPEPQSMN